MPRVGRRLRSLNSWFFRRITRAELRDAFARLGLAAGDTVYAQISLRSLGYVTGGAPEAVGALLDLLGEKGTLVMPAWQAGRPSEVDPAEVFDQLETPARCGLASEALRRHPGARRSLHPVGSVAAAGSRAAELLAGHARSATPFGGDSPLGRLAALGPRLLLVGAHAGGLLYHIMDRVGFPNMYTPAPAEFEVRDEKGRYFKISSPLLRREVPPVVILPGSRPENRDYLLVPDYALMFPPDREQLVMESGYLRFNRSRFLGRRERWRARGIMATGQIGAAQAALLDGGSFVEQISKDLAWDLARYKEEYDAEHLALLKLPVL